MSYNDFSGNDTAPHPPPPPFGPPVPQPAQPPGDDEADDWFEPVTYDQTDYEDLDAYLAQEAGDGWPPTSAAPPRGEPAFPGTEGHPDPATDPWEAAFVRRSAHPEPARSAARRPAPAGGSAIPGPALPAADVDPYAYADAGSFATPPDEESPPDGGWAPPDDEWAPPRARRRPLRLPPSRLPSLRLPSLRRRPRWMLPAAIGLAAAAIGSGAVIITTGGTSRSAAGLPIFSPGPGVTASPAMGSPTAAGSGTPARPPATPGATVPGMASPGMTTPGTGSPATLRPPITRALARQVLAAYTTANNTANAAASDPLIATVETGSSLAIDRGLYRGQRARQAPGFPAFAPVSARYYIPLEDPASYPHWFAVRVSNAPAARPGTVTSREYIVFTQAAPGGPWLDAIEPFLRPNITPPSIALDPNGYATALPSATPGLSLSPAAISAATAAARDSGAGQPSTPGNLPIDQARAAVLRRLPQGSTAATRHAGTLERVFGLRTADGGALLFYDVAARLTVTAPAGSPLRLDVPGWVAASEGVSQARLGYLEQFATYDPPGGKGTPAAVIADYSGIFRRA